MAKDNPQFDEDFLRFESKVEQLVKLVDDIANLNKSDAEKTDDKPRVSIDMMEHDDFIVTERPERPLIIKPRHRKVEEDESKLPGPEEMDRFTFMKQMEEDADERARMRSERERIAHYFRTLGNESYRRLNFEKAISQYTKAIEHVKDSAVLYTNRAMVYFKIKNYRRAIYDCDIVLNRLDEKNLLAWLYRGASYYRLLEDDQAIANIKLAKKFNPKKTDFIDDMVQKLRLEA